MSGLSTHILDLALGTPAAGVQVSLFRAGELLNQQRTNSNGRIAEMLPADCKLTAGVYRLVFDIASYQPDAFFPEVAIDFRVTDGEAHYHVPLLLSPFGYSTYRGS